MSGRAGRPARQPERGEEARICGKIHNDEQRFFEQYSRFPHSVEGLRAAGEWHELERMLPDLKGRRVLGSGVRFWLALPLCSRPRRGGSAGD